MRHMRSHMLLRARAGEPQCRIERAGKAPAPLERSGSTLSPSAHAAALLVRMPAALLLAAPAVRAFGVVVAGRHVGQDGLLRECAAS